MYAPKARFETRMNAVMPGLAHAALAAIRQTTHRRACFLLLLALAKQRHSRELATVLERELRSSR